MAYKKMHNIIEVIKEERLNAGITIDKTIDINNTGIVGDEWSDITTTLGDLPAKRTTTNPDFAAIFVKIFKELKLKKGDIVAANLSSSFPALNFALISALDTLGLKGVIVNSVGASMFGGNLVEFTYLDMENALYSKNIIKNKSIGYSLGGVGDIGKEFEKDVKLKIIEKNKKYNIKFFYEEDFNESLNERYDFYKSKGNIKAFINIGGNLLATGGKYFEIDNSHILLDKNTDVDDGLVGKFLSDNIPVLYLLNIKNICIYFNLSYDPYPMPKMGTSDIYYENTKDKFSNFLIIGLFIIFIIILKYKKNIHKKLI